MSVVSRAEHFLSTIQSIRKAILLLVTVGGVFVLAFGDSQWPNGGVVHETIEFTGFCLIVFCILGRTWCSFYIGGLKNKSLIAIGPYSMCRNPLYFFSIIGAAGVGAQVGSIVLAIAAGIITWLIFHILTFSEERVLLENFGAPYRKYLGRVPRFFPKLSLWHDVDSLTIKPRIVWATFIDACIFLISIPLAEGFDYLHDLGVLPVLFRVP